MERVYYILQDLLKSYHVFASVDPSKAMEILAKINSYRLQIATLANRREIFVRQINVPANATGYKNDVFFTDDDIDSLISRMVAYLDDEVNVSLTQLGTRENLFTRQSVPWPFVMSGIPGFSNGMNQAFDFSEEIYLKKSETLDIGIINQTIDGMVFVHGCNLIDAIPSDETALSQEIYSVDAEGNPNLPQFQVVPIQFQFTAAANDNKAVAVDGGTDIFSIKSDKTVILTHAACNAMNTRLTLFDKARNQEICNEVEAWGVTTDVTDITSSYRPLPYPHILRAQDRLQLRALNGSTITGTHELANTVFTMGFRGFTL